MYLRGPFLEFLFLAPDHGLSFIIKLTNFCTHRYTEECVWLDMLLNGETRRWYGDSNVFRWHYDWPCDAPQLQSALMALEFWLCQQIAQGINVEPFINRIITEGESLAFAGLLMDIGKRAPALFASSLKPLFYTWQIWSWDFQISTLRANSTSELIGYWRYQAPQLIALAQHWHGQEHRSHMLLTPSGAIPRTMLRWPEFRAFFQEVRTTWSSDLNSEGQPEQLRSLIERINPDNYKFQKKGDELTVVDFQWPEPLARHNEASL
jgi:hypothetical protein